VSSARYPRGGDAYDPDTLQRRDPAFIARWLPVLEQFVKRYLRVSYEGTQHLSSGPALYAGNHSGGILGPDVFCTLALLWRTLSPLHPLYAMAHDFAMRQIPLLGAQLQRVGAVAASRANAVRVLEAGGQVLVYPGGDLDAYRTFARRDTIVLARRSGFVRVAQQHHVPIVPVVAHGAHRSAVILTEGKRLASALRMRRWARLERFPVALALPWGVALGPWLPYLPLPFPVRVRVLPPVYVRADQRADEVARAIEVQMQQALNELARA